MDVLPRKKEKNNTLRGAVVVARSKMALAGGSLRRQLHGWLVG